MIAHSSYLAPKDYVQRLLQVLAICGSCGLAACVNEANPLRLQPVLSQQTSGTDIRFQAVSLVGRDPREGFPFANDFGYVMTVGNYWPYATTLFDYTRRAMPLTRPVL